MKRNKGFTLIELLVVIAIIGILSSVVLASLSNARAKGKDASVKSQMASLKAQGELYYSEYDSYGIASPTADINNDVPNACSRWAAKNGFLDLLVATKDVSGVSVGAKLNASGGSGNTPYIMSNDIGAFDKVTCHTIVNTDYTSAWAAEAPLSASTASLPSMYCSDSTGVSKITATLLASTATVCP